ncbi:MAG: hypothetical protein U0X20_07180 [Caldilineaceae bacterium]
MNSISEVVAVVGLFALRIGVPLAITGFIVWSLHHLDARWQAEAEARQAAADVSAGRVQPAAFKAPQAATTPCWQLRNCSDASRDGCDACKEPGLPCWMAKLRADGRLPGPCYGCALFRLRPRQATVSL